MTTRRQFFAEGSVLCFGAALPRVVRGDTRSFPYAEFEQRIARKDFQGITKDTLPTPCMVVDIELFKKNLKTMAEYVKLAPINLRPHVKVHKSVDVAKQQVALGAIGVTTATIAESELMSGAGIKGVLWTKQPASHNNVARAIALTRRDPTFMFVVDDTVVADWVEQAAAAAKVKCRVAVAVFAGMKRQGIENGQPAVDLAQKIAASKHVQLEGFMAYSGTASHTRGWVARRRQSADDLAGVQETVALAARAGLPVNIVSGGSTGTYNIDKEFGLTELECGSYIFMDSIYRQVGGKTDDRTYTDFENSLSVLVTVDSKRHSGQVSTDYGNKAMARPTDTVKGMPWLEVGTQGAEYGLLRWKDGGGEIKVGDRVEIFCSNLDMSTNCYDRYYIARGNDIVDAWPIMGRSGAAQR
ncbi:MAG TPA: alanine racemase [Bryobacteraceae bacterium]|nr:alanine racemase [Bryobacteraceae bacterium]